MWDMSGRAVVEIALGDGVLGGGRFVTISTKEHLEVALHLNTFGIDLHCNKLKCGCSLSGVK